MEDVELTPYSTRPGTKDTLVSDSNTKSLVLGDNVRNDSTTGLKASGLQDQDNERGVTSEETGKGGDGVNHEYITGVKLFAMLISVALAAFLMLLDASIIGVVCKITF